MCTPAKMWSLSKERPSPNEGHVGSAANTLSELDDGDLRAKNIVLSTHLVFYWRFITNVENAYVKNTNIVRNKSGHEEHHATNRMSFLVVVTEVYFVRNRVSSRQGQAQGHYYQAKRSSTMQHYAVWFS